MCAPTAHHTGQQPFGCRLVFAEIRAWAFHVQHKPWCWGLTGITAAVASSFLLVVLARTFIVRGTRAHAVVLETLAPDIRFLNHESAVLMQVVSVCASLSVDLVGSF